MMANLWNLHFFYKIENVQLKISVTLEEVYITLRPCSYSKESLSTSQGVKFQWNSCSFGDYKTITGQKCPLTFEQTLNVKFYHQRLSNTLFVLFPFPNFDWTIKLLKCSPCDVLGRRHWRYFLDRNEGWESEKLSGDFTSEKLCGEYLTSISMRSYGTIWPSGRVVNIIDQNK